MVSRCDHPPLFVAKQLDTSNKSMFDPTSDCGNGFPPDHKCGFVREQNLDIPNNQDAVSIISQRYMAQSSFSLASILWNVVPKHTISSDDQTKTNTQLTPFDSSSSSSFSLASLLWEVITKYTMGRYTLMISISRVTDHSSGTYSKSHLLEKLTSPANKTHSKIYKR